MDLQTIVAYFLIGAVLLFGLITIFESGFQIFKFDYIQKILDKDITYQNLIKTKDESQKTKEYWVDLINKYELTIKNIEHKAKTHILYTEEEQTKMQTEYANAKMIKHTYEDVLKKEQNNYNNIIKQINEYAKNNTDKKVKWALKNKGYGIE